MQFNPFFAFFYRLAERKTLFIWFWLWFSFIFFFSDRFSAHIWFFLPSLTCNHYWDQPQIAASIVYFLVFSWSSSLEKRFCLPSICNIYERKYLNELFWLFKMERTKRRQEIFSSSTIYLKERCRKKGTFFIFTNIYFVFLMMQKCLLAKTCWRINLVKI